jgi:hypothetical protein
MACAIYGILGSSPNLCSGKNPHSEKTSRDLASMQPNSTSVVAALTFNLDLRETAERKQMRGPHCQPKKLVELRLN